MINRSNYKAVKNYLDYMFAVEQKDPQTVDRTWAHLRHLLEWADETAFADAPTLERPTFPRYLSRQQLSIASITRACGAAKRFFMWLRADSKRSYPKLTDLWLGTLRPLKTPQEPTEHDEYTFAEICKLTQLPTNILIDVRDQAAVALLFISGMRAGALATLTLDCVNLDKLEIKQWPKMGVKTKGGKHATTYLLKIPELVKAVARWDEIVRRELPGSALWYAPLTTDGMNLLISEKPNVNRRDKVAKGLKRLCRMAGVRYRSPHKIRHGYAVYALKRALDMATYKAISMNLMHADLSVTDGTYAILPQEDVRERIASLTRPEAKRKHKA